MDDSEEKQSRSSPCLHCLPRLAPFFHPCSQFNDFPQALLGCSKINKASFRALGKNLSFCHPWSLSSHSSSRKPSSPDLCCFSLLWTPWIGHLAQVPRAPLPQKLLLLRLEVAGSGSLQPCCWGLSLNKGKKAECLAACLSYKHHDSPWTLIDEEVTDKKIIL